MAFSLKWKLALLLSLLLTVLLGLYAAIQINGLQRDFALSQQADMAFVERQWQQLIQHRIQAYQQYFQKRITTDSWQQSVQTRDAYSIANQLSTELQIWQTLDHWQILIWQDSHQKIRTPSASFSPNFWLAQQVRQTNKTHWYITCENSCLIWAGFMLNQDVQLTLAFELRPLLEELQAITETRVALLFQPQPSQMTSNTNAPNRSIPSTQLTVSSSQNQLNALSANRQIFSWSKPLNLLNTKQATRGLVERLAFAHSLSQLNRGVLYKDISEQTNRNGSLFWVKALALTPQISATPTHYLLYFKDVSSLYQQKVNQAMIHLLYGLGAWLLLIPLVLFLNWRPAQRLQQLNNIIKSMRGEPADQVRLKLLNLQKPGQLVDETQQLLQNILMLLDQRLLVQRLLQQRTELLEIQRTDLEKERDFIASLIDTAQAVILLQSSSGHIEMINRYGAQLIGKNASALINSRFSNLLIYSEETPDLRYQLDELSKGIRNEFSHESNLLRFDGKPIYMAWFHSRLPQKNAYGYKILTIALDISQRKQAEEYLAWLASHDGLTGLINRHRFTEELEKILKSSLRYQQSGALLYFDLDQFKDVNDSSGHQVGDELLKRVARVLRKQARETDLVARLGGDEFAMILPQADELEAAETAERICRALTKVQILNSENTHFVSASIGVTLFPQQGRTVQTLLANTDLAMLQAKEAGRNGWKLFADEDQTWQKVRERVYWNEMVKRTLEEDNFVMHYQPIQNLHTQQIEHYEALIRIFDEKNCAVSSQKFILSAENSGTIQELDMRIMARIFQHKTKLEKHGILSKISVNLSALSFKNLHLVDYISALYARYPIDRQGIIFEITETAAVSDASGTQEIMTQIKKSGYRFSLDDFGVGFSSLYYLKKFPFDFVKIDGSFVRNLTDDTDDQVMVKALVDVAQSFGQATIAEYVETPECLALLKQLKVDYAQGYFIGKPVSADEIWPELALKAG